HRGCLSGHHGRAIARRAGRRPQGRRARAGPAAAGAALGRGRAMRAVWIEAHGGPKVVRHGTCPEPEPGPGELLVAIDAASVNPVDWKLRDGLLREVVPVRLPHVMGRDGVGRVVRGAGGYRPGDRVFGVAGLGRPGTHAERVVLDPDLVAPMPR